MRIYINDATSLKKEEVYTKRAIMLSIKHLIRLIEKVNEEKIPFDKIFNNEKLKYDKHGDFYTFKDHKQQIQIRLLYSYIPINNQPHIIIADYHIKKRTNKKYIEQFDKYNNINPIDIYNQSSEYIIE